MVAPLTGNTTQKPVYIYWSPDGVSMVPVTTTNPLPVTGSGGGGGGPVTIANGADVTEGIIGDTQSNGTVVGYLKSLYVSFFGTPQAIKNIESGTSPTDHSGTITTGGSSQSVMSLNTSRVEAWVFNADPSEILWINFTGTAVINGSGSVGIPALQGWSGKVTSAVSVIATTTGHVFTAGER